MAINAVLVGSKSSGASSPRTPGSGTTTTGSTFVIAAAWGSGSISSITDTFGNSYTQIGTNQGDPTVNHKVALFYCSNGTGGASHSATVNFSTGPDGTAYLIEITGAATASFDKTAQGSDTSTPYTLTSPTLSQADEVVITLHGSSSGGTVTYASSNTTIIGTESDGNSFWTSAVSKLVVSSTSAVTPSFTGGDNNTAMILATFKAAAAGSSVAPRAMAHYRRGRAA